MREATSSGIIMRILFSLVVACIVWMPSHHQVHGFVTQRPVTTSTPPSTSTALFISKREAEIRRKIMQLKKEGRLKKSEESLLDDDEDGDDDDDAMLSRSAYEDKVVQRLGKAKSKMLGFTGSGTATEEEEESNEAAVTTMRQGQLGSLPQTSQNDNETSGYMRARESTTTSKKPLIDPSLFMGDDEEDEDGLSEDDLVDLVEKKMMEKRDRERREKEQRLRDEARAKLEQLEKERMEAAEAAASQFPKQTTSGVGGSWSKNQTAVQEDMYKPKSGSWGAFPRPKDISKAYGGGRRIGPGFSDEAARAKSTEETRERLKRYREKMGIEVATEKEHAGEIDEALNIAALAMRRGVYSTAVSALEKVTKWCSTNSKVGGKVFLELAMAYEAVGRTKEAIAVYTTLSTSRMEDIKFNAKRLLYGLEAMEFMQKEVRSKDFQRKKAKNAFIETTGMDKFTSNFDDRYQTAYVDLQGHFYKKLTESVVRTPREARQILLRATDEGDVGRTRIVQALRSISRNFDEALQKEIERNTVLEPVAVMNGKPIVTNPRPDEDEDVTATLDGFKLMEPSKMMDRLDGEWRLQLLANKRGDGVKFFNNTVSWQQVDTNSMSFTATVPAGFVTVQQTGKIFFNDKRRILRRQSVEISGGGVLAGLFGAPTSGPPAAVRLPQQIMTVDSVLLVTRGIPSKRVKNDEAEKDYFAVWRKVDRSNMDS